MPGNWKTRNHYADQATQRSASSFALLTAIAVWCAVYFGFTQLPEQLMQDALVNARNQIAPIRAEVLLVQLPETTDLGAAEELHRHLPNCLKQLRSLGAKAFVLPACVMDAQNGMGDVSTAEDVFLSIQGFANPRRKGLYQIESVNVHRAAAERCGITAHGAPEYGIHRAQPTGYFDGFHRYPAIEPLVADFAAENSSRLSASNYRINFRGDAGSLPYVSWDRLLNQKTVADLVEDRVVVFGYAQPSGQSGIYTPTTRNAAGMTMLEYQGHALNTLLTGTVVQPLPLPLQLLALVGSALIAFVIGRMMRFTLALFCLAGVVGGTIALAMVLLDTLSFNLPLLSMAVCGIIGLLRACELRQQLTSAMTRRMLADLSRRPGRREFSSVFTASNPWQDLAALFEQAFPVDGIVFFEVKDRGLNVTHIERCEIDKNAITSLTLQSAPFATAYAHRRPIALSKRNLTIPCECGKDSVQFLIPLGTASDLIGFALILLPKSTSAELSDLERLLNDFGTEATELLNQRKAHQVRSQSDQPNGHSWLDSLRGGTPEHSRFRKLKTESEHLNRELSQFERLFHDSDHPTIVFDIFGKVLLTNGNMSRRLSQDANEPGTESLIDFLQNVASISPSECRELLRNVLTRQFEETLAASWQNRNWLIKVRPLQADTTRLQRTVAPDVFSTEAIVVELMDQTRLEHLTDMRLTESERVIEHLRTQLESLEQANRLLESELTDTQQSEVRECIRSNIDTAVAVLEKSTFGRVVNEVSDTSRFGPCDLRFPLELAAEALNNRCSLRSIRIAIDRPESIGRVFGNPAYLKRFFTCCLNLALTDARDSTVLATNVTVEEELVHVAIRSNGPGLTNEELRRRLKDATHADGEYSEFRECCTWLEQWGGRIVANGVIGQGLEIKTSFRRFD